MLTGDDPSQQIDLLGKVMVIGRHPDCDVVLEYGAVSRQHAHVVQDGTGIWLEDLGSRNGTFVNDHKIEGRYALQDKDRLQIGDCHFVFRESSELTDDTPADREPVEVSRGSTILSTMDVLDPSSIRIEVKPEAKLRAILEISNNLGQTLELDKVLPKILESLFKIFPQADNGYVVLKDPVSGQLVTKADRKRSARYAERSAPSRTIIQQAMSTRQAILSSDAATDSRFESSQSIVDFQIRSMICAPLVSQESGSLGVIQLETCDIRRQFQQEDLDTLISVASTAAVAVENAKLHETAVEQERLKQELVFAEEVQKGFLPTEPPSVERYQFFHYYEAAKEVGGDYYDYIHLPDQKLAITLGDVAGKGVPAALLMARLSALVGYSLLSEPSPAGALSYLDQELDRTVHQHHFVTCVLTILECDSDTLLISNAGHPAPLLRKSQTNEVLPVADKESGLPLGVMPSLPHQQASVSIDPGDLITIFSDGVTEASDMSDELYDTSRLIAQIESGPSDPEALGNAILEDVHRFSIGKGQSDDITLICFRRIE